MKYSESLLWHKNLPENTSSQLEKIFSGYSGRIFFRADDIGVMGNNFTQLIQIFSKYNCPLCLAVVPAWLNKTRWTQLTNLCNSTKHLWCWHQHGWKHFNHEPVGKKCEFGESRTHKELYSDIVRGKEKLHKIMGPSFYPAFTPPWNRCSAESLAIMQELKFAAVSRSKGAVPKSSVALPDLAVNVDLHTRKEDSYSNSWNNLWDDFQSAIKSGTCGIMIHHQRMNNHAFLFLDILLSNIVKLGCSTVSFNELSK